MNKQANKVVICGATGMVGKKLVADISQQGFELVLVGRNVEKLRRTFTLNAEYLSWESFRDFDAEQIQTIINLSGAGVSEQKWTPEYQKVMVNSRIQSTKNCVEVCKKNRNIRLINASAVSAYGFYTHDHSAFSEDDINKREGASFLQSLIDDWEAAACEALHLHNAIVLLRIGVVLDKSGGGLPEMAKPFRVYLGGRVGTGEQVMSWISLRDLVSAISFISTRKDLNGPVNLVSPGACRQKSFAKALGKALHKPSFLAMPSFMIKASMGQMGEELVLNGQRVLPVKLQKAGFEFKDTDIETFLTEHYEGKT